MPRTSMLFTIDLLESDKEISTKILRGIAEDFNLLMRSKTQIIRDRVGAATILFLQNTDTYISLMGGDRVDLGAHFGLPSFARRVMVGNILQKIGNNIEVEFKPVSVRAGGFIGGPNIGILITGFSDILGMMEGEVVTEKGQVLPWLRWLLERGDEIIINEYEIDLIRGKGRSGGAIMVKNTASVWRVPPEYSGVINDNWFTRALISNSAAYLAIIQQILEEELS